MEREGDMPAEREGAQGLRLTASFELFFYFVQPTQRGRENGKMGGAGG